MRVRAFHLSVCLSVCLFTCLRHARAIYIYDNCFSALQAPLDKRFLSRCSDVPNWFRQFAVLNEQRPEAHLVSRLKRKRVKWVLAECRRVSILTRSSSALIFTESSRLSTLTHTPTISNKVKLLHVTQYSHPIGTILSLLSLVTAKLDFALSTIQTNTQLWT